MFTLSNYAQNVEDIREVLKQVFSSGGGTAQEQWCLYVDSEVEPAGWNALWKLSKNFCKKFGVRYPCVVQVLVASVNIQNLSTDVEVLSVQHEAVCLPENVMGVPLIELWPTLDQHEDNVTTDRTAKCIDLMRLFYEYLWMPWDEQNGKVLLSHTVEERLNLWIDIQNKTIPKYISRKIILLRNSAIHAYKQLQKYDSLLNEDCSSDDDSLSSINNLTHYAILNAKLDGLMSKWTLYENSDIRHEYFDIIKKKYQKDNNRNNLVVLWQGGNIEEFSNLSIYLQNNLITEKKVIITTSVEEALSQEASEVVIYGPQYEVPEISLSHLLLHSISGSTLIASEMRSCLLMLSDECKIENLKLNCSKVNTVIVMLEGKLYVKNCMFFDDTDDNESEFAQGIVAKPGAQIELEDCSFENFYSAIIVQGGAQMQLRNCKINKCGVGIQMCSGAQVKMDTVIIEHCLEQPIQFEMENGIVNSELAGLEMKNCKM